MSLSVSRAAVIFAAPAWVGLLYTLVTRPIHVEFPFLGSARLPEVHFVTVAALVCGLLALICAVPGLAHDLSDRGAWLLVVWCAIPFFVMLALLNPLSAGPMIP